MKNREVLKWLANQKAKAKAKKANKKKYLTDKVKGVENENQLQTNR